MLDPSHGIWANTATSSLTFPKKLKFKQLLQPVTICFNHELIPHVKAQNDHDLYFTQGYITAYHRLWQMDFQARYVAGRLSEIIGPKALSIDRLQRRKGLPRAAKTLLQNANETLLIKKILIAYTAGVNAYINSLNYRTLPLEYKLLNFRPEPWSPYKTALIGIQLIDQLTSYDAAIENTNAFHLLGKEQFNLLFPEYLKGSEPLIPPGTRWHFKVATPPTPSPIPTPTIENVSPHHYNEAYGSNGWAISGKRTATGNTILANDLHFKPSLPSPWYLMHLTSPNMKVTGATVVGLPNIIIGFNEKIAWGATNAMTTVRDWYHIEFADQERKEYYYDQQLLKTQTIHEVIKIKGKAPFHDTFIYTHLGPIVYDNSFPSKARQRKNLAMKWIGHQPNKEILTFYLLNRAQNYQDFQTAFQHYITPGQQTIFASINDNIAVQLMGRYPIKWKEQGKFVMQGNRSSYQWQGMIPFEHNPKLVNPPAGYVSAANQRPTDLSYPYYYYGHLYQHYRHRYLKSRLKNLPNASIEDMKALQNDIYSLKAKESLPTLLPYLRELSLTPAENEAYQLLKRWNLHNDVEQLAPTIFATWVEQIQRQLWKSLREESVALPIPVFYTTLHLIKHHPHALHDYLIEHDTVKSLIQDTFMTTIKILSEWKEKHQSPYRWGDAHETPLPHLLQLPSLGVKNTQIGGNIDTLNANTRQIGTSIRMLVELKKNRKSKAWMIYPGGQPGNPVHPCYTQFLKKWEKGEYITLDLKTTPDDLLLTATLQPASNKNNFSS